MTPTTFRAWRKHMDLSQTKAAEVLGVSRRTVINWEQGESVPKTVELACAALALGIRKYDGPQA